VADSHIVESDIIEMTDRRKSNRRNGRSPKRRLPNFGDVHLDYVFFGGEHSDRHDRNTVPSKRAIYGTLTAVSSPFLNVYVKDNGDIRSFTIVVSIDLGFFF